MRKMIWIAKREGEAQPWMDAASDAGWQSDALPLIEQQPLPLDESARKKLESLENNDWIFLTSPLAARLYREQFQRSARASLAVIGKKTETALLPMKASFLSTGKGGAQLAHDILSTNTLTARARCIHFAAESPRKELREGLSTAGVQLDLIAAYRTTAIDGQAPSVEDAILLFSPSSATSLSTRCNENAQHRIVAVGETTARTAAELNFSVNAVLNEPTPSELTRELMQWATTTT